ncbi:MAG TPA: hypothetical protein VIZ87_07745 [Terrimicrobium sp.]
MRFIAELCEREARASRLGFNLAAQSLYLRAAPFTFRHLGFGSARATGFLSASF